MLDTTHYKTNIAWYEHYFCNFVGIVLTSFEFENINHKESCKAEFIRSLREVIGANLSEQGVTRADLERMIELARVTGQI